MLYSNRAQINSYYIYNIYIGEYVFMNMESRISPIEKFVLLKNAELKFSRLKNDIITGAYKEKELFKVLEDTLFSSDCQGYGLEEGAIIYRAREIFDFSEAAKNGVNIDIDNNQTQGFDASNSVEPPIGLSKEGRNNKKGVSYLYAAEDVETACTEIKSKMHGVISVAELKVMKNLSLIDFSEDRDFRTDDTKRYNFSINAFITLVMREFTKLYVEKQDYMVSQAITDFIRKHGIDGLSYQSYFTGKKNYTIFNSCEKNIAWQGSRLFLNHSTKSWFLDFDGKKLIGADSIPKYDEGEAQKLLSEINKGLKNVRR